MTYEEFIDFVTAKCMYETIYEDSEGRLILVIDMLIAYGMVNKLQREWVGLTTDERDHFTYIDAKDKARFRKHSDYIEATLKEKNT
jgi:hypothetical protein